MAKHLITFILNDEYDEIENETDLAEFTSELRRSTHADLITIAMVYNVVPAEED